MLHRFGFGLLMGAILLRVASAQTAPAAEEDIREVREVIAIPAEPVPSYVGWWIAGGAVVLLVAVDLLLLLLAALLVLSLHGCRVILCLLSSHFEIDRLEARSKLRW